MHKVPMRSEWGGCKCIVVIARLLALTLLMTSCASLDVILATPTPVPPMEIPSPSPTIAWFPATATPTLPVFFTPRATAEMRPGLGLVVMEDRMLDPSIWDTAQSDEASAAIIGNRLTLAVQSRVYMTSLRQGLVLDDFYTEITARPSLCRGQDSYGFLVRANAVAGYRFSLYCNGMISAERVSVGKRQILQEVIPSGDVPPGAPGEVRIGVWALGNEMRLFLNGRYQFSVTEPSYPVGTVGVFVNSAGPTAATVSFSDLSVQEVLYVPPTQTPAP